MHFRSGLRWAHRCGCAHWSISSLASHLRPFSAKIGIMSNETRPDQMNVRLSPEEYRKLVELAYLGEWVINAHHDTDFQDDQASATEQRVLEAGPIEGVDQDEETKEYYLQAD